MGEALRDLLASLTIPRTLRQSLNEKINSILKEEGLKEGDDELFDTHVDETNGNSELVFPTAGNDGEDFDDDGAGAGIAGNRRTVSTWDALFSTLRKHAASWPSSRDRHALYFSVRVQKLADAMRDKFVERVTAFKLLRIKVFGAAKVEEKGSCIPFIKVEYRTNAAALSSAAAAASSSSSSSSRAGGATMLSPWMPLFAFDPLYVPKGVVFTGNHVAVQLFLLKQITRDCASCAPPAWCLPHCEARKWYGGHRVLCFERGHSCRECAGRGAEAHELGARDGVPPLMKELVSEDQVHVLRPVEDISTVTYFRRPDALMNAQTLFSPGASLYLAFGIETSRQPGVFTYRSIRSSFPWNGNSCAQVYLRARCDGDQYIPDMTEADLRDALWSGDEVPPSTTALIAPPPPSLSNGVDDDDGEVIEVHSENGSAAATGYHVYPSSGGGGGSKMRLSKRKRSSGASAVPLFSALQSGAMPRSSLSSSLLDAATSDAATSASTERPERKHRSSARSAPLSSSSSPEATTAMNGAATTAAQSAPSSSAAVAAVVRQFLIDLEPTLKQLVATAVDAEANAGAHRLQEAVANARDEEREAAQLRLDAAVEAARLDTRNEMLKKLMA